MEENESLKPVKIWSIKIAIPPNEGLLGITPYSGRITLISSKISNISISLSIMGLVVTVTIKSTS